MAAQLSRPCSLLLCLLLALLFLPPAAATAPAAVFTVTSANDSNDGSCDATHCSLREALQAANARPGTDGIHFNIGGGGAQTIRPTTWLPRVNDAVLLDGTTQPGYAGVPLIELNGSQSDPAADGMTIVAGGSTVRGLVINRFGGSGLVLADRGGNVVEQCWIGTDATGTRALGNANGIVLLDSPDNRIGGGNAATRNVISGNRGSGIALLNEGATRTTLWGNWIGLAATGAAPLGNEEYGIFVASAENRLGGDRAGMGNVVVGSGNAGIFVVGEGARANRIQGNGIGIVEGQEIGNGGSGVYLAAPETVIGGARQEAANQIYGSDGSGIFLDGAVARASEIVGNTITRNARSGIYVKGANDTRIGSTMARPNQITENGRDGILIEGGSGNEVGSPSTGYGNLIARNAAHGIALIGGVGNSAPYNVFSSNDIYDNGGLGIDLKNDGVTPNDVGDRDGGPNGQQNFPTLERATATFQSTRFFGTVSSTPQTLVRVELFVNASCDLTGHGEGTRFLGGGTVRTGDDGSAPFAITVRHLAAPSDRFSATATASGGTSEFGPCAALPMSVLPFNALFPIASR